MAAVGGSVDALETLWSWAKEVELNADELLQGRSELEINAFQLAAGDNHIETLKKLWVCAE